MDYRLTQFVAEMGDFEFACALALDGTYGWHKKLLNTCGAVPEPIASIDDVPVEIMAAFVTAQVKKQAQSQPS